ncbi:ABC transporter permease subunit [Thermus albus]|uniref:ABC transporter permease subunit n=1 Tax=Thermus albus TaxID=2908146 RepID=UPI001FAAFFD0|nr:ABC transporter permease subunit [Thermus albus]
MALTRILERPNRHDLLALLLTLGLLALFLEASREAVGPFHPSPISLDPAKLPEYTLRTTFRMGVAFLSSFLFTLIYAPLAAKTRLEPFLIALLDILQSVSILGFLAATAGAFAALFPGRALGYELAAIFAVFTSQAWNMAFSFYQSLKTLPRELEEVATLFRLSPWQRFLRLELPFALPGLVWNAMISMSGGWFFVVASEAIAVGKTQVELPGIGSYLATAIAQGNGQAVLLAALSMLVAILAYDQLLFRPLVAWSQRFKYEERPGGELAQSWVLDLLRRTHILRGIAEALYSWALETLFQLERRRPPRRLTLPLWAVALDPQNPLARYLLGLTLVKERKGTEAKSLLLEAHALYRVYGHVPRGVAAILQGL